MGIEPSVIYVDYNTYNTMKKLFNKVCDKCQKTCNINPITAKGKKRELHYCSPECLMFHRTLGNPVDRKNRRALYDILYKNEN